MRLTNTYILVGKKVVPEPDFLKWALWFHNIDNRRIGFHTIKGIEISTVFLGMDVCLEGTDFFETRIAWNSNSEIIRYSTYEEAEEGHLKACERVVNEF